MSSYVLSRNVLDGELQICSYSPLTGYTRNGRCDSNPNDSGAHLVCAKVTKEFLEYTKSQGNDLTSAASNFPGLKPGDKWCLCASRWAQAQQVGLAPPVDLNATTRDALAHLSRYNMGQNELRNSQR
jgi:uncharacterized protein (DUF2237 family)